VTNYDRGANFEREVVNDLLKMGLYAQRSAGSHGAVDVLAYCAKIGLFIQCKKHGVFPPGERYELFELAKKHGAIPILAHKKVRGRITYLRLAAGDVYDYFSPETLLWRRPSRKILS